VSKPRWWSRAAPMAPAAPLRGDALRLQADACLTTKALQAILRQMDPNLQNGVIVLAAAGGWTPALLQDRLAAWNHAAAFIAVARNPHVSNDLKATVRGIVTQRLRHRLTVLKTDATGPVRDEALAQVQILGAILVRDPATTAGDLRTLAPYLKRNVADLTLLIQHANATAMVVAETVVAQGDPAILEVVMASPFVHTPVVSALLRTLADEHPQVMARLVLQATHPARQRILWPALRLHWPALAEHHPDLLARCLEHVPPECLAVLTEAETTAAMASSHAALRRTMIEHLATIGTSATPVLPARALGVRAP
jgi:hypothetical protein